MKKVVLFAASLLTAGAMMAQTIVSTQVEKRNVVIEEFTGVNCQYCPDGHRVANEICAQYEGHAWAINIHTGSYATNSGYVTTYGDNIAGLWNITGYPTGTVNRTTIQSRGDWAAKAATIRNQDSPVNIAGVGNVDEATRTFTLHIEVYYTGNASTSTHLLNVAVLQNNVIGSQVGSSYNPDYVEPDGRYRHMHMFRTLLTGQWGVEIPATEGTFIDTTITYTVPASIDGLAIPDLSDLDFVAFVTEPTHKNIISGAKVTVITQCPVITGFKAESSDCSLEYTPYVTVYNSTESNITSITFNYDGAPYTVNKAIASFQSDTVHMPVYTVTVNNQPDQNCAVTKTVSITSCTTDAGTVLEGTSAGKTGTFADFHIYTAEGPFTAIVGLDCYASEASVSLLTQHNCQAVWTEDSWTDIPTGNPQYISQIPDARYDTIEFDPAVSGLYIIRLGDSWGDGWGWTNNTVVSGFWLNNDRGEIFAFPLGYSANEDFSTKDFYLNVINAGINNVETVKVSMWPNPASTVATISAASTIRNIEVINTLGQVVNRTQNINAERYNLNVSNLNSGIYFVNVTTDNGTATQRMCVVK